MENPKKLYGHQHWPPQVSVEHENIVEGHFDMPEYMDDAKEQVKDKYEEGAC